MDQRMAQLLVAIEVGHRRREAAQWRETNAAAARRRPAAFGWVGALLVRAGRRLEAAAGPAGGEWVGPETTAVGPRG
jgi:hypothetical protein